MHLKRPDPRFIYALSLAALLTGLFSSGYTASYLGDIFIVNFFGFYLLFPYHINIAMSLQTQSPIDRVAVYRLIAILGLTLAMRIAVAYVFGASRCASGLETASGSCVKLWA